MKKKRRPLARALLVLLALLGIAAVGFWARYGRPTQPFPDRSTPPLLDSSAVEAFAVLDEPPGNVAVARDGRVFFTFHPEAHPRVKVAEWAGGRAVPFPDERFQRKPDDGGPWFDTPLSLRIDRRGRLWTIDHGFHGLRQPRLLAFDPATGRLVHRWDIPRTLAGRGSYVQDFQVAPDGRSVYVADVSAFALDPALIVYDVERRSGRRLLTGHPSVRDKPYTLVARGKKMRVLGGLYALHPALDSIALDAAGEWLYYGPVSHETLFRIRTAELRDETLPAAELARRVEPYGPKPQSDGISMDLAGTVYLTDVEHGAIAVLAPDRRLRTLVRDDRFRWLDGLSFGPGGWLYATDSALQDVILKSRSHIRERGPYTIWRLRPGAEGEPGH